MSAGIDPVTRLAAAAERTETGPAGSRVVWRAWGAGRPVVLLHGDFGSWTHFIRNIDSLAAHFRVLVPNLPGYDGSDLPDPDAILADSTRRLSDGLDHIIGADAGYDLVGFSFGGMHAAEMARIHGRRVGRLVVIGTGGFGFADKVPFRRRLMRWEAGMPPAERAAVHRNNLAGIMFARDESVDDLAVRLQDENTLGTRLRARGIPESDALIRTLPHVSARLAAIWGAEDVFSLGDVPRREAMLRRIAPELDFRTVEGAGHWVLYEAAEAVNDILLEMLG